MERSGDWMSQAESDLDHARHDVDAGFFEWACFSAQQAAEKAAKAVFQRTGDEAWGQSVADLLQAIDARHTVSDDLIDAALELDNAYISTRHPDAHPSGTPRDRYTRKEAERLISYADQILRFCHDLLAAS